MNRMLRILHWINFDTAMGAVITSLFIADYLRAKVPGVAAITLFLAVLAIYNFDHLMDARRVSAKAKTSRHRFYQLHQRALSIYQLLLVLGLINIIWYLPVDILRAGLVLALLTGIYFILLFFVFPGRFAVKELMIAIVYSSALFLAPIYSLDAIWANTPLLVLWIEILLLALANTLIFAWYDHEVDLEEGHSSLASNLLRTTIYKLVVGLLITLFIISGSSMLNGESLIHQELILLMALILLISLLANGWLQKNDRYRIVGDAVFLLPIIILFL